MVGIKDDMNKLEVKSEPRGGSKSAASKAGVSARALRLGLFAVLPALTGLLACGSEPTVAECGRYYSHISRLQESGHGAVSAALRTASGKNAVINYCLRLPRHQIDCSLKAGSLAGAQSCESRQPKSILDQYKDYIN